jgi:DNA-damage-inducible protein D
VIAGKIHLIQIEAVEVVVMSESANIEAYRRALDAGQRHAPDGSEYWLARDLMVILSYARWENFIDVVRKGMLACENSGVLAEHHFRRTAKVMTYGKGSQRKIEDWFLSRYACYLIAMNGDPRVDQVAYAQQYFAVQTRLQEKSEEYDSASPPSSGDGYGKGVE